MDFVRQHGVGNFRDRVVLMHFHHLVGHHVFNAFIG